MNKSNFGHERLTSNILSILNNTLKNEIYDDLVKKASFTEVKLANDKSFAKVYVDSYDRTKIDLITKKVQAASGVFRTALARSLTTYKVPKLIFVVDPVAEQVNNIEKLLSSIK